jgi:glutamate-5-semialdehyde dehydrogenase
MQQLAEIRAAGQVAAALAAEVRTAALRRFAELIDGARAALLDANRRDLDEQRGVIEPALYQRLALDDGKIDALASGVCSLAESIDPVGRVLDRTLLDDGLVLDRIAVPIGVIGVIFESRPDVIPQILSLVLRSGNVAILKGGREALHSNRAFMQLVAELNREIPALPAKWASLLESREEIRAILDHPEYVDLVIPRGSNELVRSIQEATRIPVLGHAEGVCHVYVHGSADVAMAVAIAIDAKVQYPSACNALETLLVDGVCAGEFLPRFAAEAGRAGVALRGCERTRAVLPRVTAAIEADAVPLCSSMSEVAVVVVRPSCDPAISDRRDDRRQQIRGRVRCDNDSHLAYSLSPLSDSE